jgi:putative hydrolase of the HAD superfamily
MNKRHSGKYKCIFFDLDHTLWDYEANAKETLHELYTHFNLQSKGVAVFDDLLRQFRSVNLSLWDLYDRGVIGSDDVRRERFKQTLEPFGICNDDGFCKDLTDFFMSTCPMKCKLIPQAIETLEYLIGRYNMTIITNGFDEIQHLKMTAGKLHPYFDHIITSQKAGHRKPSKEIFEFALELNDVKHHEAIMIGDNLVTDIGGARNASIDAVFFNPEQTHHNVTVDYEINNLEELRRIL